MVRTMIRKRPLYQEKGVEPKLPDIEERPIEVTELRTADEAFVTSTSRGMVPVVLIDDLPCDGTVGHHTRTIMKLLDEYEASY